MNIYFTVYLIGQCLCAFWTESSLRNEFFRQNIHTPFIFDSNHYLSKVYSSALKTQLRNEFPKVKLSLLLLDSIDRRYINPQTNEKDFDVFFQSFSSVTKERDYYTEESIFIIIYIDDGKISFSNDSKLISYFNRGKLRKKLNDFWKYLGEKEYEQALTSMFKKLQKPLRSINELNIFQNKKPPQIISKIFPVLSQKSKNLTSSILISQKENKVSSPPIIFKETSKPATVVAPKIETKVETPKPTTVTIPKIETKVETQKPTTIIVSNIETKLEAPKPLKKDNILEKKVVFDQEPRFDPSIALLEEKPSNETFVHKEHKVIDTVKAFAINASDNLLDEEAPILQKINSTNVSSVKEPQKIAARNHLFKIAVIILILLVLLMILFVIYLLIYKKKKHSELGVEAHPDVIIPLRPNNSIIFTLKCGHSFGRSLQHSILDGNTCPICCQNIQESGLEKTSQLSNKKQNLELGKQVNA